jgi:hypothetical protein
MIAQYATDSPEALKAISDPEPKHVWIHGSITYVYTGEDIPEQGE